MKLYFENGESAEIICADTYWLRLRGLIGRPLAQGQGLLLKPCRQVHCCFMSQAIDVLHLDAQNRILCITPNMEPFSFGKKEKKAKAVLELFAGDVQRLGLRIGMMLTFREE